MHESIQALNISDKAKAYFNKLELYEIINDEVILEIKNNETNEVRDNRWSFSVDLKFCTKEDIKAFYQAVINSRQKYIRNCNPNHKMTFYTYYEAISGNFYLSLISNNNLLKGQIVPFDIPVNIVKSIDNIIQEFIDCPYKGSIPFSELKELDPADYNEDDEDDKITWVPNVWSVVIP